MKKSLQSVLLVAVLVCSVLAISSPASASGHHHRRMHCEIIAGHWHHGVWHKAHKHCWMSAKHCKVMPGHWRYGHWYPSTRVC